MILSYFCQLKIDGLVQEWAPADACFDPQFATLRALPVSRNDFKLESTRGQPPETLFTMSEPGLKSPWMTSSRTVSSTGSISNVTRETSASLAGSAQVSTSRLGGTLSTTLPVIRMARCSSPVTCTHFEPGFQSETFSFPPQYWRANSGFVMAFHSFSGVVRM